MTELFTFQLILEVYRTGGKQAYKFQLDCCVQPNNVQIQLFVVNWMSLPRSKQGYLFNLKINK